MAANRLSTGQLEAMMRNVGSSHTYPMFFQLLDVKQVTPKNPGASTTKRFRFQVNDGAHTCSMMVATQMAIEVEAHPERFCRGAILQCNEIIANDVQGRRVIIGLHFSVVGHCPDVIGNPVQLPEQAVGGAGGGVQEQPPPPQQHPGPLVPQHLPAPVTSPAMWGAGGGGTGAPPLAAAPVSGGLPAARLGVSGPGSGAAPGFIGRTPLQQLPPSATMGGAGGVGAHGMGPVYNMQAGGAIVRNDAPAAIVPIASLNAYNNRWTIKARVTSKSGLKRFNTARGNEGKLFSFDLLDKAGGEIRATAFNEQADKFYEVIQVGRIFLISKGAVAQKKPEYNNTAHDYEIRLAKDSVVEVCPDDPDAAAIPALRFNFVPIAALSEMAVGAFADVLGIVEQVNDWQVITRKTGEETRKRSIVLRDASNASVEVTLWGDAVDTPGAQLEATYKSGGPRPVLAVKAARLGDFNGRNLGTVSSTVLQVEPTVPEAEQLRAWYRSGGATQPITALSGAGGGVGGRADKRVSLAAIRDEDLGKGGKPEWVTVAATLCTIASSDRGIMYPACQADVNGRKCQKKMQQDVDRGGYACPVCGPGEPMWRYMLSVALQDHTRQEWVTSFNETSEVMLDGVTADTVRAREVEDPAYIDAVREGLLYTQLMCRVKVAEETYNEEQRVKLSLQKVEKPNWTAECKVLLELISKMEAGLPVLTARGPAAAPSAAPPAYGGAPGGYGGGPPGSFPSYGAGTQAATGYGRGYGGGAAGGFTSPTRAPGGFMAGGAGRTQPTAAVYGAPPGPSPQRYPAPQPYGGAGGAPAQQGGGWGYGGVPSAPRPTGQQQAGGYGAPAATGPAAYGALPQQQPYGYMQQGGPPPSGNNLGNPLW